MFIDRIKLSLLAGRGGDGVIAWRRAKYIPKGGPGGGDGGHGGSIIIRTDSQVYSLEWFKTKKKLKAENGKPGGSNQKKGRNGQDMFLRVPCGTLVKDAKTGAILYDLTEDGQEIILCTGGKGGRGNATFKTPTNRAPLKCTPGRDGQVKEIELELKLIADVGLVGYPNAGKSTLLSALADVEVKTAAYPFTTLHPNLGFVQREDYTRLFIADIPGIIEYAHMDKGLGLEFLRHIERTKLLIYVLDASGIDGRNPIDDYNVLQNELKNFNPELMDKPYLVVLNKVDAEAAADHIKDFKKEFHIPEGQLFEISALEGKGVQKLANHLKSLFEL